MHINKILVFFVIFNSLIIISGYFFGFSKSLWLDELLSIIYGREIIGLSLIEIFTIDPHNPFFYSILNIGQTIIKLFTLDVDSNLYYLKFINLIGLVPIYLSFKILKKEKTPISFYTVFLLLISSNYFIFYILDLRPYFLILSFSFLIYVLHLTNTLENKYKLLFFISSIILSALHIYGLTLSMSIIVYRFMLNLYKKNYSNAKVNVFFSIVLFIIFIIFYFLQISNKETMATLKYININFWYFRTFIEWTLNSIIFIFIFLVVWVFQFKNQIFPLKSIKDFLRNDFVEKTLNLSLPALILVIVVVSISYLVIPIIHFKPLIVIFPALVLYSGVISFYIKKTKKILLIFCIFLVFCTSNNLFFYLKNILYTQQNIEWVIKKTFTKNCKDIDVYFNDKSKPGFIKTAKQISKIYSKYERPIKPLAEIKINNYITKYKNTQCDILIFSFHSYGLEKFIETQILKKNNLVTEYAPNVVNKNSSKAGAIVYLSK